MNLLTKTLRVPGGLLAARQFKLPSRNNGSHRIIQSILRADVPVAAKITAVNFRNSSLNTASVAKSSHKYYTSILSRMEESKDNYPGFSGLALIAAATATLMVNDDKEKEFKEIPRISGYTTEELAKKQDVVLFTPQVFGTYERVILWLLALGTAGIGYALVYPIFAFQHHVEAIKKIKLPDGRKLQFNGKLGDFYLVYLTNWILNFGTLGLYYFLGFADQRIANYLDLHTSLNVM